MIGKTIDISVTSVLQTTAGKMIFGKWDERATGRHDSKSAPPVGVPPVGVPPPAVSNGPASDPGRKPAAVTDRVAD